MECKKCKRNVSDEEFCDSCFVKIIEKRIRKNLRENLKPNKSTKILTIDTFSKILIKKIIPYSTLLYEPKKNFNIKEWDYSILTNKKLLDYIKTKKIDYIILPLSLDNVISSHLELIFNGKKPKLLSNPRFILIFESIKQEDLERFKTLKGIKTIIKTKEINKFLNKIENKHSGTKNSYYNSIKKRN